MCTKKKDDDKDDEDGDSDKEEKERLVHLKFLGLDENTKYALLASWQVCLLISMML